MKTLHIFTSLLSLHAFAPLFLPPNDSAGSLPLVFAWTRTAAPKRPDRLECPERPERYPFAFQNLVRERVMQQRTKDRAQDRQDRTPDRRKEYRKGRSNYLQPALLHLVRGGDNGISEENNDSQFQSVPTIQPIPPIRYPGGEVVGSTGKIGSYLLHRLNSPQHQQHQQYQQYQQHQQHSQSELNADQNETFEIDYPQSHYAAATPRHLSPGCLSPPRTPIYACIPSSSIQQVWDATLPSRREDLVFVCNCIPSRHLSGLVSVGEERESENGENGENGKNNVIAGVTIAIPHFGVSQSTNNNASPLVHTSPQSPPTVIYGKHASTLGKLLQNDGIPVRIAETPEEVQIAAVKKLVWSSLMWLLCHDVEAKSANNDEKSLIAVKDVHEHKSEQLESLVKEILPALSILFSEPWAGTTEHSNPTLSSAQSAQSTQSGQPIQLTQLTRPIQSAQSACNVEEILEYLKSYSMSLSNGNVTPSKELALKEIHERNGLILSLMHGEGENVKVDGKGNEVRDGGFQQRNHSEMLHRVAGEKVLAELEELSRQGKGGGKERVEMATESATDADLRTKRVRLSASNMELLFSTPTSTAESDPVQSSNSQVQHPPKNKSVIIIGAGIVGSSIAYHLSLQGVNVTVMDQRQNLLPNSSHTNNSINNPSVDPPPKSNPIDPGTATSSTFAWLNANDKSPFSYMQFNQLGMEVWRRHSLLKGLVVWCGALIRRPVQNGKQDGKTDPYYLTRGPLTEEEVARLEPGVDWSLRPSDHSNDFGEGLKETEVYFYPEEGHVDPISAVKALRLAAVNNGARFMQGVTLQNLVRSEDGRVVGVKYTQKKQTNVSGDVDPRYLDADIVVIAAGANSSNPLLGIGSNRLPLLDQPGILAYAKNPATSEESESSVSEPSCPTMQRIVVDTLSQSHILRRPDGTLVIGGGKLIVGGSQNLNTNTDESSKYDGAALSLSKNEEDALIGTSMIQNVVQAVAPHELLSSGTPSESFLRVTRANRPMPSDGLPVVGYVDPGLYVAVSHSAITLGPLIGELAAYEMMHLLSNKNKHADGIEGRFDGFQILNEYRPSRFSGSH